MLELVAIELRVSGGSLESFEVGASDRRLSHEE